MCTSLTYTNKNGGHFLARTMDFNIDFGARVMLMPRNRTVQGDAGDFTTKYGFVGAGRQLAHEMFTDGVNEYGVGVATLYFPDHAVYQQKADAGKLALAPADVVAWILGNANSVADLQAQLKNVQIVSRTAEFIGVIPPLHFIISDPTGKTAVLEPTGGDLHLTDDPVGVMTNSPDLHWHLQNISTYGMLTNVEQPLQQYGNYQPETQGPGTGAIGLPGDYTSISRFVRTNFLKHYTDVPETTAETLNLLQFILNSVTIPKGVKKISSGQSDYTEYRSYMDLDGLTYSMELYENPGELQQVALTADLLNSVTQPVEYPLNHQPRVHVLNPEQVAK
ncbi:linear amide C-N hydrolase [Lactiplantibacillus garii]|uniref:Linear amide C-N hydrolase n=1 Tax=Lactiplantibacillus garii TaxID=2306423 RepID=A0A426D4W0_9LACO|nr:choloylglycine hydrolase family protein [Lactiplantibacillus garii]RRK09695.1 linear amide C-N hydrolase [Lactiplantibacillus garii]